MKRMNTKSQWLALSVMALAATVFALGSAALWALEPGATPKAGTCDKMVSAECKANASAECKAECKKDMGKHAMLNLAEFKKVLANAKALAENGDAKGAATEIARAEVLMTEGHAKLGAKMAERGALRDKFFQERLTRLETLLKDFHGINLALADRPDSEDLSRKMDEIYKSGQLLREQLTRDGVLAWFRIHGVPVGASPAGVTGPEGKVVPVVNEKCPMCGHPLDREKVPADLRVEFKGKPVGFCGKECIPAWNKLTDEDKQAKLDKVMLPPLKKEAAIDPDFVSPTIYPDPSVFPPIN